MKDTREMFVTMLFALSPNFVALIEKTIKIAVDRSSAKGSPTKDHDPLEAALARLTMTKDIKNTELRRSSSFDSDKEISLEGESRRTSIARTPKHMIAEGSFTAAAEEASKTLTSIRSRDLYEFNRRRRSGDRIEFRDTFRSAAEPVSVTMERDANVRHSYDRRGIGYADSREGQSALISSMNQVLGSLNTKSVDYSTGEVHYRKPQVQDFLDSESVSASVYRTAPDVASEYETTINTGAAKKPLPTEYYLPSTVGSDVTVVAKKLNRVDSFEELLRQEGYA